MKNAIASDCYAILDVLPPLRDTDTLAGSMGAKPSSAMEIYRTLREDLPAASLAALKADVRRHFDHLVQTQKRNELIAIDLAEMLCVRLEALLETAHSMDADTRASVVGAARYFASAADALPDDQSCTGLDDDVAVFNHVVRTSGRLDLVIDE